MLDLDQYRAANHVRLIRIFRKKTDAVVALMRRGNGQLYVCRIYDHPVCGYEAARKLTVPELPQVYRCEAVGDSYLVEEEFVNGIQLSELLEVYRPDESQTAAIVQRICRALAALHEHGVIHRDVKPENVLLIATGRVVLIDLDAASSYISEKPRDTRLLGTVGYAAPEQFGFGRSDVRTDIFGLGVMMNMMRTGEHPSQTLAKGPLRPVIERCIAVNAGQRYSSTQSLLRDLNPLAGKSAICPDCGFVSPGGGCLYCGRASASRRKGRKLRLIGAGVLAAAAILAIGLGTYWLRSPARTNSADVQAGSTSMAEQPVSTASVQPQETQTPAAPADETEEPQEAEKTAADEPEEPHSGSSVDDQWDPGDREIVQTSFERYPLHITYDSDGFHFPSDTPRMPVPFYYDLDGDGVKETYYFGPLMDVEDPTNYIFWDSVGRPYDDYDRVYRRVAPVVFERAEDGKYLPVDAFAGLIEDPKVTVYYTDLKFGTDESCMPTVYESEPVCGVWQGSILISYRIQCIGGWVMEATGTIDGTTYTGFCLTQLRTDWRGIELE